MTKEETEKSLSMPAKAASILLNVLLWLIVIMAAFFSIVTFATKSESGVARIGGYTPMAVLSESMKGEFGKGDMIVVKQVDPASLQVGDIISYWTVIENKKAVNTHRIVELKETNGMYQFMTKGDANELADDYIVSSGDIIGKYVALIPVLGNVLTLLSSSMGFLLIIVLPLLAFFVYQLYRLIVLLIELKKQTVMEATKAAIAAAEAEKKQKNGTSEI